MNTPAATITLVVTTSRYGAHRLGVHSGTELFSVHLSTMRGCDTAIIRTTLPGCYPKPMVGGGRNFAENAAGAHQVCARAYEDWLAANAGVTATVAVDATDLHRQTA